MLDLPCCVTRGRTRERALAFAHEAVVAYVVALRKLDEPIHSGSPLPEAVTVAIAL